MLEQRSIDEGNRREANQVAKEHLKKAGVELNPMMLHLLQLMEWGLEVSETTDREVREIQEALKDVIPGMLGLEPTVLENLMASQDQKVKGEPSLADRLRLEDSPLEAAAVLADHVVERLAPTIPALNIRGARPERSLPPELRP